jgi:hypothetical protein
VATFADGEVVTAKRSLAVMARHAAWRSTRRVMIERFRRGNLSALRHAGPNLVAFGAGNFFMLGVIKADPECLSRFRGPGITT